MQFEELVCFSQIVILIIVGIVFVIKWINRKNDFPVIEDKCPICNSSNYNADKKYCSNCSLLSSHSEGLSLDKKNITNITNITISDSVISKSNISNKDEKKE